MKITIAIDSFKGSLSTLEAGNAVAEGIRRVDPCTEIEVSPLADGGEGTVSAILAATGGEWREVCVSDPLSRPIRTAYGIIPNRHTAIIEMSAAAGLPLLTEEERDPMYTTTFGVGEMIADALSIGCKKLIIGIGGSSTNDGGVGMLQALGFTFRNAEGKEIPRGARGLESLCSIGIDHANQALRECEILVACDVDNPLCGVRGCSAVFAPQKGASSQTVALNDRWLASYAALTRTVLPHADPDHPGAGAAGGMGFALLSYLGATLQSGIDLVMTETGLEEKIRCADLVITGEGRLDAQSCMGKAPVGVARLAKRYQKPVIALSGCVTEGARACNENGIDAFFPILQAPCTLAEAMDKQNAVRNLSATAEQVYRLFCI